MSPHAVLEPVSSTDMSDELDTFGISENAFLPAQPPLDILPDSYYQPWEHLATHLSELLKNNTFRDEVLRLPILSTDRLFSEPDRRRAYSILTFLTHGYIWGGSRPSEVLPPSLAIPLLAVSNQVELPPVATYAALNLWNYRTTTPETSPADLDNLAAQLTFTGTTSESWFYMVSVAMEAEGGAVIPAVLRALRSIRGHDAGAYSATTAALEALTTCIRRLTVLLARMHEHCDPHVFYYDIRPFLAGSLGMANAGLPRGVFYDEGDGKGQWCQLRGGSNGQSSLIQFLDIALGVEHAGGSHSSPHAPAKSGNTNTKSPSPVSFHQEVRDYMPGPHRRLLETVQHMGSLRSFCLQGEKETNGIREEQRLCQDAYHTAVDAMTEMRNGHLKIVARFIVLPSVKPWAGAKDTVNLASASSRLPDKTDKDGDEKLTGTGGTDLMPFLRKARDETIAAGR